MNDHPKNFDNRVAQARRELALGHVERARDLMLCAQRLWSWQMLILISGAQSGDTTMQRRLQHFKTRQPQHIP